MNTQQRTLSPAMVALLGGALLAGTLDADAVDSGICTLPQDGLPMLCSLVDQPYVDQAGKDDDTIARQSLDIYFRPDLPNAPVVVFVPGGAWKQGDKGAYQALAKSLTGHHGLTTVVINYRLSDGSAIAVRHPAHVQDVAAAFAFVKRHIAPYGDPERVYLFGQSAGAHLVSLLATDDRYLRAETCVDETNQACSLSDIRGVVSMSGVYDLPAMTDRFDEIGLDGALALLLDQQFDDILTTAFGRSQRVWQSASPIGHISPEQPPFLVIYSFDDLPGFAEQAHEFSVAVSAMLLEQADAAPRNASPTQTKLVDDPADPSDDPLPPSLPQPLPWDPDALTPIDLAGADTPPRPAPRAVELRRLERIDYSAEVWSEALCLSGSGAPSDGEACAHDAALGPGALFAGHYAEVVAINPSEPWSEATRLVVDFIASH